MNKENHKSKTFVFFGIAGSGKGTQIELLEKFLKNSNPSLDITLAYPGSEFRKLTSSGSYTGELVKEKLEGGFLQPDFITISLFSKILTENLSKDNILIADGYPRTIGQSQALESAMDFYSRSNISIIYIKLSKEEASKRMKLRGRSDDTDIGIAQRFDEYVNNILPAMNYFKDKEGYEIYTVNGEQSVEDVHKELISKLEI